MASRKLDSLTRALGSFVSALQRRAHPITSASGFRLSNARPAAKPCQHHRAPPGEPLKRLVGSS